MKLYRAIEFSKIIFMLSHYGKTESNDCNEDFISRQLKGKNWWLHNSFETNVKNLIADVVANGHKNFFQKSLTYNSIRGGRYNHSNSFGMLYSASNPAVASLEVLFHIFDDKKKYIKSAQSNLGVHADLFDEDHPSLTKHLIVIFEFEIQDHLVFDLRGDQKVRELCERIGFDRYTSDPSFDEDFIFGNNYEVSRLAGSYLNTLDEYNCYKFRSARIPKANEYNDHYNLIIPERFIESLSPKLTGNFYLCEAGINILEDKNHYNIRMKFKGNILKDFLFRLERPPANKIERDPRTIAYSPSLPEEFQPRLNSRYVCHQRFKGH